MCPPVPSLGSTLAGIGKSPGPTGRLNLQAFPGFHRGLLSILPPGGSVAGVVEIEIESQWTAARRGDQLPNGARLSEGERLCFPPKLQKAQLGWGTVHRGRTRDEKPCLATCRRRTSVLSRPSCKRRSLDGARSIEGELEVRNLVWATCRRRASVLSHPSCKRRSLDGARSIEGELEKWNACRATCPPLFGGG